MSTGTPRNHPLHILFLFLNTSIIIYLTFNGNVFKKYNKIKFSDLSEKDQIECKFEIIDMLHFFLNYAISIGMTPKEVYNMYMAKNKENRERQLRGY